MPEDARMTIMRSMALLPNDNAKIDFLIQQIGVRNSQIAEFEEKIINVKAIIDKSPKKTASIHLQKLNEIKNLLA